MLADSPLMGPVVALALWTLAVLFWMYTLRLPALTAANIKSDPNAVRGAQVSLLPARVRWKADNYTHLLEQPPLFYAVTIVLALIGQDTPVNAALAWTYVGIRVAHTLVQTLVNKIELRFVLFALSSIVLAVLAINAARAIW